MAPSSRLYGFELRDQSAVLTELVAQLSTLPDGLERAASMAINKALESGRVKAVALLRAVYAVKIRDAKQTMAVHKCAPGMLLGSLDMRGNASLPLSRFSPRPASRKSPQPKRGISLQVTKGRGRVAFPHAFEINKPGGVLIMTRVKGAKRLPIKKLYGPSFLNFFDKMENWDLLTDFMEDRVDVELERAARWLLKKAGVEA